MILTDQIPPAIVQNDTYISVSNNSTGGFSLTDSSDNGTGSNGSFFSDSPSPPFFGHYGYGVSDPAGFALNVVDFTVEEVLNIILEAFSYFENAFLDAELALFTQLLEYLSTEDIVSLTTTNKNFRKALETILLNQIYKESPNNSRILRKIIVPLVDMYSHELLQKYGDQIHAWLCENIGKKEFHISQFEPELGEVESDMPKTYIRLMVQFIAHEWYKELQALPSEVREGWIKHFGGAKLENKPYRDLTAEQQKALDEIFETLRYFEDVNYEEDKYYHNLFQYLVMQYPLIIQEYDLGFLVTIGSRFGCASNIFAEFSIENINYKDEGGETAFLRNVREGNIIVVGEFLKAYSKKLIPISVINVKGRSGMTAFLYAILKGHVIIVKEFLEAYSQGLIPFSVINAKNQQGLGAFELAQDQQQDEIIMMFKEAYRTGILPLPVPSNRKNSRSFL